MLLNPILLFIPAIFPCRILILSTILNLASELSTSSWICLFNFKIQNENFISNQSEYQKVFTLIRLSSESVALNIKNPHEIKLAIYKLSWIPWLNK